MAEEKKYSKEDALKAKEISEARAKAYEEELEKRKKYEEERKKILEKRDPINKAREEIIVKNIIEKASTAEFGSSYSSLQTTQQRLIVSSQASYIAQEDLTELGIYTNAAETSIQQVLDIVERQEIISSAPMTIFNLDCSMINIPEKRSGEIYSLTDIEGGKRETSIFSKPIPTWNDNTNAYEDIYTLDNFLNNTARSIVLEVGGDQDAWYELVIRNITDEPDSYWDGYYSEFQTGYRSSVFAMDNVTQIPITLPAVSVSTRYAVYFTKNSGTRALLTTTYNASLPTATRPWYIDQLVDAKTSIYADPKQDNFGPIKVYEGHDGDGKVDFYDNVEAIVIVNPPNATKCDENNPDTWDKRSMQIEVAPGPTKDLKIAQSIVGGKLQDYHIDWEGINLDTRTHVRNFDFDAKIDENGYGIISGFFEVCKWAKVDTEIKFDISAIFHADGKVDENFDDEIALDGEVLADDIKQYNEDKETLADQEIKLEEEQDPIIRNPDDLIDDKGDAKTEIEELNEPATSGELPFKAGDDDPFGGYLEVETGGETPLGYDPDDPDNDPDDQR